jgi:hypothetical protein
VPSGPMAVWRDDPARRSANYSARVAADRDTYRRRAADCADRATVGTSPSCQPEKAAATPTPTATSRDRSPTAGDTTAGGSKRLRQRSTNPKPPARRRLPSALNEKPSGQDAPLTNHQGRRGRCVPATHF